MGFPRRVATSACALAVGTAVLIPVLGNESAQAGSGSMNAGAAAAAKPADYPTGIHSKKGKLTCKKRGETAWIWDSAVGATRVSWKAAGKKLVSRTWKHKLNDVSTRTVPTWRKSVTWKVTSTWGHRNNLLKAYGYCSTQGWRMGGASDKLIQKKSGTKTCPAGKTVYISSTGIGNIKHRFKPTGGGALRTHNFGSSQDILVTDRATPTELRSVKWRVEAWSIKKTLPDARTGRVKLACISKY